MNDNPTTHPAHARELARELREHRKGALTKLDAFKKFNDFNYDNALDIAATLDALADACERLRAFPARHQVFAWLGYWRDHMPAEAVKQLQDALGPLFETTDAMQTDS